MKEAIVGGVFVDSGHVNCHMLGVGRHLVSVRQYDRDLISITTTHAVSSGQHMSGVNQGSGAEEKGHSIHFRCQFMQGNNPGELIKTSLLSARYPIPLCWTLIGLAAVTFLVCIAS